MNEEYYKLYYQLYYIFDVTIYKWTHSDMYIVQTRYSDWRFVFLVNFSKFITYNVKKHLRF